MKLTPYQVVAPLIAILAIVYAWSLVLRKKKTVLEACLWTLFWGAVAGIAFEPNVLSYLSVVTGIANAESAALVTFIGLLFFIVFYLVMRIEELERRHTRVVRALALREGGLDGEIAENKAQ